MDNRHPPAQSLLASLPQSQLADAREPAPVHLWNPEFSGELDMYIARDGTWYYQGGPITRTSLAQLFSGILRLDEDGRYYLITPVERWVIKVEDVPFVMVRLEVQGKGQEQLLTFHSSLAHRVIADAKHPISVHLDALTQEPSPYIVLRDNLLALIHRNVFYQLAELAVERELEGVLRIGVWSSGVFFPIDGDQSASMPAD